MGLGDWMGWFGCARQVGLELGWSKGAVRIVSLRSAQRSAARVVNGYSAKVKYGRSDSPLEGSQRCRAVAQT